MCTWFVRLYEVPSPPFVFRAHAKSHGNTNKARLPMLSHGTNQLVTCLRGFARCARCAHIKLQARRHANPVDRWRYSTTSSRFLRIATPSDSVASSRFTQFGLQAFVREFPTFMDALHALLHAWSVRIPQKPDIVDACPYASHRTHPAVQALSRRLPGAVRLYGDIQYGCQRAHPFG